MNFILNTVGTSTASGLLQLSLVESMGIVVIKGKSLNVLLLIFVTKPLWILKT